MDRMDDFSLRVRRVVSVQAPAKDVMDLVSPEKKCHVSKNPEDVIDLGPAQNRLLGDVMREKMNQVDVSKFEDNLLLYQDNHGMPAFRTAIADFLTQVARSPQKLDPDKICISCGLHALLEVVPYILCDEGDTILVPAPVYGGIMKTLTRRPNVKVCLVHVSSQPGPNGEEPFELTVEQLEKSYTEAKEQGSRVKALVLVNPHNPMGTVYTREQVMAYLQFCKKYDLHVIIDEIYVASIFDHATPMSSVLSFAEADLPDPKRCHFLWSFGKGFACAGFACGVLYSWNEDVVRATKELTCHHPTSSFVQSALTQMLQDKDWVHNVYLPTSHCRLREARDIVMATLDELGASYIRPTAGLFVWANLNKFMGESTHAEEMLLCKHLISNGLLTFPSSCFYSNEAGWFRIVFSVPFNELRKGMERLVQGCRSFDSTAQPTQDLLAQASAITGDDDLEILEVSTESGESLESLVRSLMTGIKSSGWLQTNTSEKFREENPETYEAYMEELNRTDPKGKLDK